MSYQVMPPLTAEEREALKASIAAGYDPAHPVVVDENGSMLDGHHREEICAELGIEPPRVVLPGLTEDQKRDYAIRTNLARRHLSREQRDAVLSEYRERGMSVREIAEATGVARSTVADAVKGQVSESGQVTGKDGKAYPAHPATKRFATSGDNEWYSPPEVVDAARRVMGGIDLDPASCAEADQVVQAGRYYTAQDDGLDSANRWKGRVFMNPPYSPSRLCAAFCDRLAREYAAGNVDQAVVLVNNATETKWFQGLSHWATALCIPCRRFKYWKPDGESAGAMQGQAILYLGDNAEAFQREFAEFGQVTLLSSEPGEGEDLGDCPWCGAGGKYGHMPGCEASMVPLFTEAMNNLEWAVVRAKVRVDREVPLDAEKVVIQLETLRVTLTGKLEPAYNSGGLPEDVTVEANLETARNGAHTYTLISESDPESEPESEPGYWILTLTRYEGEE